MKISDLSRVRWSGLLISCLMLLIFCTACFSSQHQRHPSNEVTFYGWGGDDQLNAWLDTQVAPLMREKHGITLTRVPMEMDQILAKLTAEQQAEKAEGTIDIIWINGENFASAKEKGLLYGPFADRIDSLQQYFSPTDSDVEFDFGVPTQGYEVPFGKSQLILVHDRAKTKQPPQTAAQLLSFAKEHPGQVTYPAPPDFTGSAFVRSLLYELVGYELLQDAPADKDALRTLLKPGMDYFVELAPYLWSEGTTYPATIGQLQNMFADGEVLLSMDYNPYHVAVQIEQGRYPNTAQTFLLKGGMVANAHYLTLARNAPNVEGAVTVINELLSPALQLSKFEQARYQPSLDLSRVSAEERALFEAVPIGEGVLSPTELSDKRLPELPSALIPLIEEIWLEEVVEQKKTR